MRLAVDANLLIYVLEGNPIFGKISADFIKRCLIGATEIVVSELMYVEVLAADNMSEAMATRASRWLEELGFTYKPVTREVLLVAASLRRHHNLRTPDAVHIATAILGKCGYFITNDRQILKKKIKDIELISLANVNEATLFPRDNNRLAP